MASREPGENAAVDLSALLDRLARILFKEPRARALLAAFDKVADFARELPAGDGRIATLGHSMGGGAALLAAAGDPTITGVALGPRPNCGVMSGQAVGRSRCSQSVLPSSTERQ